MRVYIGYDQREDIAYRVAAVTALRFGCEVIPLTESRLQASGLMRRFADTRGVRWDFPSSAHASTEFAISRFFVPLLAHDGWVLFTDCDVVFLRDPHELLKVADPTKAVQVVKHNMPPSEGTKMDGQPQVHYSRKNWSSVMLINASHPAHKRLTLDALNSWPGRDLHAFAWLSDDEIGELPACWNWLVDVQPKPDNLAIAHFTLGIPTMRKSEYDPIWNNELDKLNNGYRAA